MHATAFTASVLPTGARAARFLHAGLALLAVLLATGLGGCDESMPTAPPPPAPDASRELVSAEKKLKEFHTANLLPSSLSLIYEYELQDGTESLGETIKRVVWDFEAKKARTVSFGHSHKGGEVGASVTIRKNDEVSGISVSFNKKKKAEDIKSYLDKPFSEISYKNRPRCHVSRASFSKDGQGYPGFLYDGESENPTLNIMNDGKSIVWKLAEGFAVERVTGKNERIVLTFDNDGFLSRKEVFTTYLIKKEKFYGVLGVRTPTEKRTLLMNVKKRMKIGAFTIPTYLEFETQSKSSDDTFVTIRMNIKVHESSIKVNEKYDDSFFTLKIPADTDVYDDIQGIYYMSDGTGTGKLDIRPLDYGLKK